MKFIFFITVVLFILFASSDPFKIIKHNRQNNSILHIVACNKIVQH